MSNVESKNFGVNQDLGDLNIEAEQNIDTELEGEAKKDVGTSERKRIEILPDADPKEIQSKYGVSKSTAYRAIKQGWLFINYQQRLIDVDPDWAEKNIDQMKKAAKSGAAIALSKLGLDLRDIRPFDMEDIVSSSYIRLMELSGHPERYNANWRITVAKNGALNFINDQIVSVGKRFKEINEEQRNRIEE